MRNNILWLQIASIQGNDVGVILSSNLSRVLQIIIESCQVVSLKYLLRKQKRIRVVIFE